MPRGREGKKGAVCSGGDVPFSPALDSACLLMPAAWNRLQLRGRARERKKIKRGQHTATRPAKELKE